MVDSIKIFLTSTGYTKKSLVKNISNFSGTVKKYNIYTLIIVQLFANLESFITLSAELTKLHCF